MEETYPRIKKVPVAYKYYCECKHEITPFGNNYCGHCGRKLNWDSEYIDLADKVSDTPFIDLLEELSNFKI